MNESVSAPRKMRDQPSPREIQLRRVIIGEQLKTHDVEIKSSALRIARGNEELAKEIYSQMVFQIMKAIERGLDPEEIKLGYYVTAMKNVALNIHAKSKIDRRNISLETGVKQHQDQGDSTHAWHAIEDRLADEQPTPEEIAIDREREGLLRKAIADLPDKQLEKIAVLYFLQGKSYEDISRELGIGLSTLHRKFVVIKKFMKENLY